MDGHIQMMVLEDFVTYKRIQFNPKPHLNIILGPNGTGKSSLVCAMVLGLGGKPKVLGRATSITSYIRAGCKTAKIEIELLNRCGPNHVILRTITDDGKSTWTLNGTVVAQKQVDDLVSKLNIQVDNLCQFLPQDRVADFSRMNPQQLLENTQKCIGTKEMFEYHTQLKELRKQQIDYERQLNSMSEKVQSEQQRNNRLQVEVGNISEKKTLLQMVESLKQKRAWLMYENVVSTLREMKADKENAEQTLKKYQRIHKPMDDMISASRNKLKQLERNLAAMNPKTNEKLQAVKDMKEAVERIEDSIKDNAQECDRKIQAEEKRQKEVTTLMQQISKLQNDLKNATPESEKNIKSEVENLTRQLTEKGNDVTRLLQNRENHQNRLEKISQEIITKDNEKQKILDVANQRLELLRRRSPDVYQGVKWLRENKTKFKSTIYEPMMLEINVNKGGNAKYLENIIPNRDLLAFTCEDKTDMNHFLQILRQERNLKINVVHSGPEHAPSSSFKPTYSIGSLRKYGFHSYVKDMFSAPESIMKYLCRMYRLHNIPVGDDSTFENSEDVPRNINQYFSANHSFSVNISKYTGEKSTQISELSYAVYLSISVNMDHLQEVEARLSELTMAKEKVKSILSELQLTVHQAQKEIDNLRGEKKRKMEQLERIRTVAARLKTKQSELNNLENDKLDPDLERARCREQNQDLVLKLCSYNEKLVGLLRQYEQSLLDSQILKLDLELARDETLKKENGMQDLVQKCNKAKSILATIEERIKQTKAEGKKLYQDAKKLTNGIGPEDQRFSEFKEAFHLLGDTEDELDREIQDTQAKADCLGDANDVVMEEFDKRKAVISSLNNTIQSKQKECEKLNERMASINEKWLPPLKQLVKEVNKKYGECFAHIGCAGEVALITGQNENDYEEYGLSIKVKYRDGEQLQTLTQHLQSGGERAVATAIYMISLQELTRVPFCCVDEINQGMDADNERMIFELLVNTTKQRGAAQYFLLSPKLLPSLQFDRSIQLHYVYQGVRTTVTAMDFFEYVIKKNRRTKPRAM